MTESDEDSAPASEESSDPAPSAPTEPNRWGRKRDRPTVRSILKEAAKLPAVAPDWDRRDNDATRLPESETILAAGITLVEVFTPSTISALYRALNKLPLQDPHDREKVISEVRESRNSDGRRGWTSLGAIRAPGTPTYGHGFTDNTLPNGVSAVWLSIAYPTASITSIVATFSFTEEAADISDVLRRDYARTAGRVRIRIPGSFGSILSRIPWHRPKHYRTTWDLLDVRSQKRTAFESVLESRELDCWKWLSDHFSGRFAAESHDNRPSMRILLTSQEAPFSGWSEPMRTIGLEQGPDTWTATDTPGWSMKFDRVSGRNRRYVALAAANVDAVSHGHTDDQSWYATQIFHTEQLLLPVHWANSCLLSLYSERLGHLRDRSGARPRFRHPVRQARELDKYLLGDGLDASSVSADIEQLTANLRNFRHGVPEYTEDQSWLKTKPNLPPALELIPRLCEVLSGRAQRIRSETSVTIANISASAELRQSMANTRLQRVVVFLAVIATVAAVASLVVALKGSY